MLTSCYRFALLMRLHRPIGISLLLWPTLWALWIAASGVPDISLLIVFVSGVILMRSAGCVINDLADVRFDAYVARTKNRPLVTGQVSTQVAMVLFGVLCLVSAALLWFLNPLARWLAIPAFLLAAGYPFMKRFTHWPQFILGLAFSWGIPMAFAAQSGRVPLIAWQLFLVNTLWAMAYDTIYAMVDRPDDQLIDVKSTAILFGDWDTKIVALLHGLMLALLVVMGWVLGCGIFYYAGLVVTAGVMLYLQYLIHDRAPDRCF